MLESFYKYLEYEKRYSSHTVISYKTDLTQFSKFLQLEFELDRLEDATFPIIRSWIVSIVDQGISSKSVNRKIATLRTFFKFLLRQGVIQKDPMLKVKAPKVKKALPVFVEENKMIQLLDQVSYETGFSGTRDKLIMELLYGTGIRLSELISLQETDLNLSKNTIKVLGKGNKERVVPINRSLAQTIAQYLTLKNQEQHTDPHVILTDKGNKSYAMFIYRVVKKYLNIVTSVDKKSPHVLRHTFATHLLNKGADLNAIKELLGHSNLAATQVYTHNSLDKLKNIFSQAHPKA